MFLYRFDHGQRATAIREKPFTKEKDLQVICERNLETIFGMQFVCSEFALNGFRIDTLAFDRESRSFVILEYKRNEKFSVIDQGYAYLSLMLNNKADFILEYNETQAKNLRRDDVDWSQSRVLFVSPSFTSYQRESINFRDLPIELWEVRRYENDTLHFNQIKPAGASESIRTISKQSEEIQKVSSEVKVYTEDDHLSTTDSMGAELFAAVKDAILGIGTDLSTSPKKLYVAFVANKKNIADVHLLRNSLKMWINLRAGELNDPGGVARDVSSIGHWGNGDYEVRIQEHSQIPYVIGLVQQSYRKNVGSP
ncbi:MAG TPA: DUF5655 domain-containing protein [Longimicrobiaceae bacterium]|nr:DUF5655 domain-containing protein [Longimicrobiaceae bacterium]